MIRYGQLACLVAGIMLAMVSIVSVRQATAARQSPLTEIRASVSQALEIMHDKGLSPARRRRELQQLAQRKLDFARMAQGSLGAHWSEISPAQRDEFVPLFASFIEDAYLDKIQDYANLKIDVANEQMIDPNHADVSASVIQPGEDTIPITFMVERVNGNWMIYDVAVEDVSMVENYRAQFDRVIRTRGMPRLIADLKAKQAQLAALLGTGKSEER